MDTAARGAKERRQRQQREEKREMDVQQSTATRPVSSDDEDAEDNQRRRRQRGHGKDHNQSNVNHVTPQTTQEDASPATSEDKETHEMTGGRELDEIQAVSGGGVTVNERVYVRKNPARGARPQREAESKKPVAEKGNEGADI